MARCTDRTRADRDLSEGIEDGGDVALDMQLQYEHWQSIFLGHEFNMLDIHNQGDYVP